jgi:hypothetical protein
MAAVPKASGDQSDQLFTVTPYALIDTSLQDSGPSRKKLVTLVTDGCNPSVENGKIR